MAGEAAVQGERVQQGLVERADREDIRQVIEEPGGDLEVGAGDAVDTFGVFCTIRFVTIKLADVPNEERSWTSPVNYCLLVGRGLS